MVAITRHFDAGFNRERADLADEIRFPAVRVHAIGANNFGAPARQQWQCQCTSSDEGVGRFIPHNPASEKDRAIALHRERYFTYIETIMQQRHLARAGVHTRHETMPEIVGRGHDQPQPPQQPRPRGGGPGRAHVHGIVIQQQCHWRSWQQQRQHQGDFGPIMHFDDGRTKAPQNAEHPGGMAQVDISGEPSRGPDRLKRHAGEHWPVLRPAKHQRPEPGRRRVTPGQQTQRARAPRPKTLPRRENDGREWKVQV